jgi:hypothetical protein
MAIALNIGVVAEPTDVPDNGIPGPKGERGSRFLGSVATPDDLPPPDGVDVAVGDYVIVESTGDLWSVVP